MTRMAQAGFYPWNPANPRLNFWAQTPGRPESVGTMDTTSTNPGDALNLAGISRYQIGHL